MSALWRQPQRADQPGDLVAERVQHLPAGRSRSGEHSCAHAGQRRQRVECGAHLAGSGFSEARRSAILSVTAALCSTSRLRRGGLEEIADREQPFLLKLLDQANRPDRPCGRSARSRPACSATCDAPDDDRHGERDHAEQRRDQQQRQLAADAEPTEQHRIAPTVDASARAGAPCGLVLAAERRPFVCRGRVGVRARSPGPRAGRAPAPCAGRQGEDDDRQPSASSSASSPARQDQQPVPGQSRPGGRSSSRSTSLRIVAESSLAARLHPARWTTMIDGSDAGRPACAGRREERPAR